MAGNNESFNVVKLVLINWPVSYLVTYLLDWCVVYFGLLKTLCWVCSENILKQYVSYFFMFNEENYIYQFPSVSRSVLLTFCVLHLVHNSSERKLAGEKVIYFPVCSVKMTTLNFQCEL
jgi:hypothetical protein